MSLLRRVIGGVLRRVRMRQGRTLREVAAAAGVSMPYLSEVERGRKEASSEVLAAVCRALGIRLSDLLGEARDELRRLERPEPMGFAVGEVSRTPSSRVEPARQHSVRAGLRGGGPTSCGTGQVHLRLGSPGLPIGGAGLAPIGPALTGGSTGGAGLRVRLIAAAPADRPTARRSWRVRRLVRARGQRARR
ncbi:helix-turn-helix domain-containing protein [Salinispora sp. H7-4]|uniref:helix-turn-helix domain-containing protein n=1 Tax=Salinispora sp. H7-4 TaxID=2748321 RepID=UPI0015D2DA9A|nr:helix-turn-helix domain-containing protein [Salinispora sp. H7-4]NYT95403.1 helix-turn-helix domain-containing protein [Salinispora sp. H7-4]